MIIGEIRSSHHNTETYQQEAAGYNMLAFIWEQKSPCTCLCVGRHLNIFLCLRKMKILQ